MVSWQPEQALHEGRLVQGDLEARRRGRRERLMRGERLLVLCTSSLLGLPSHPMVRLMPSFDSWLAGTTERPSPAAASVLRLGQGCPQGAPRSSAAATCARGRPLGVGEYLLSSYDVRRRCLLARLASPSGTMRCAG